MHARVSLPKCVNEYVCDSSGLPTLWIAHTVALKPDLNIGGDYIVNLDQTVDLFVQKNQRTGGGDKMAGY